MASIKKCNDNVKCFCVARNTSSHLAIIKLISECINLTCSRFIITSLLQAVIRLDASGLSRCYPLTFIKLDDKLASVVSTMHQFFQLTDI